MSGHGFALKDWLESRAGVYLLTLRARGYSEKTLKVYRSDLNRMVSWFDKRDDLKSPGDIGRGELVEYAAALLTATAWGKRHPAKIGAQRFGCDDRRTG